MASYNEIDVFAPEEVGRAIKVTWANYIPHAIKNDVSNRSGVVSECTCEYSRLSIM